MIERALIDYYRFPDGLVKLSLTGELSEDSGYFRFGPDTVCYGQSACGSRHAEAAKGVYDTLPAVTTEGGLLRVPFDPSRIVDNLRLERYAADPRGAERERQAPWQTAYYSLRSFIPAPLRRALQRTYFRDWRARAFPRWPVDNSVEQILERLVLLSLQTQRVARLPFVWFWPDGASSCAIVTHDVETSVGFDRCSWLMDVDDGYGIKSSFQIVPEGRYPVPRTFLEGISARGFEVGLHDLNHDGRLFSSREEFLRRAPRINEYARAFGARGFRSGSLYRHPEWLEALEISYDMSIPNVGHLEAQRGGCCTVMPYFVGRILELPLTAAQDYTLLHILKTYSIDLWTRQIDAIMRKHGLISVIVHPDYLDSDRAQQMYGALLKHLSALRESHGCWITLPGEVDRWWRQRSQMTLVQEDGRWRIEGQGKERARVAYAELDGDKVIFDIESASRDSGSQPVFRDST